MRLHRWQPTRLPHPWDSPGKNTGVGCHFFLQCMKVKSESEVTQPCRTLRDPMDCSGKTEWGGHPVCWWLSLYFCFVCGLDEASCIGCYWWLGDAGSCIPAVACLWVLTIWYPLGLVLWLLKGLGDNAPTPNAQGLISGQEWRFHKWFVMALSEIKTISKNKKPKMNPKWQLPNQANNN